MASSVLNGAKMQSKNLRISRLDIQVEKNRKDKDEKANKERIKRTKQGADPKVDRLDGNPPENR